MQATRVTKDENANMELEKQQTRETKNETNDMHSSQVSSGAEVEDGSPHKVNWTRGSANNEAVTMSTTRKTTCQHGDY